MCTFKENLKKVDRWKLYLIALVIRLVLLGFFGESWDIYVFITATKQFLLEGKTPYEVALSKPPYIYLPYYPFIENWFAYPPLAILIFAIFYSFYLIFPFKGPFFERFFIKLPMAIGDLLLAFFSYHLVLDLTNRDENKAKNIELFLLYNPLLILISSVWGMFDALVTAFIVLSIFYLERGDYISGAFFYAVAALLKQTAFFIAPFYFFLWIKNRGLKRAFIYTSEVLSVFVMTSIVFYISSPSGFLQQILMLHVNRPPWGYNIFTLIYFAMIFVVGSIFIDNALYATIFLSVISSLSLSMLLTIILAISLHVFRKDNFVKADIVYYAFIIYLTFIFTSKVTNEQYFIYPITLGTIYAIALDKKALNKVITQLSYYLTLSTLVASMRFIIFIPPDILVALIGIKNAESLWQMTPIYGESSPFVVITMIIAIFLVSPSFLKLAELYIKEIRSILSAGIFIREYLELSSFPKFMRKVFQILTRYRNLFLIILILLTTVELRTLPSMYYKQDYTPPMISSKNIVAIHYTWLDNPTHDPEVREGSWAKSFLTPLEGYYETKTPYVDDDFLEMEKSGINSILLDIFPGRVVSFYSLVDAAEKYNLTVIPHMDIGLLLNVTYLDFMYPDIGNGSKVNFYYSLKTSTYVMILNTLLDILSVFQYDNVAKFNDTPILVIDGINLFLPGFGSEELSYQIDSLYDYYNISFFNRSLLFEKLSEELNVSIASETDLLNLYPKNLTDFLNTSDPINAFWVELYKFSFKKFWEDILEEILADVENLMIIIGYDDDKLNLFEPEDYLFIANSLYLSKYAFYRFIKNGELREKEWLIESLDSLSYRISGASIGTAFFVAKNESSNVIALYSDYNYTWEVVLERPRNITIIYSWNDYLKGSVIEPTVELEFKPLQITKYYVQLLRKLNNKVDLEDSYIVMVIIDGKRSKGRRRIKK